MAVVDANEGRSSALAASSERARGYAITTLEDVEQDWKDAVGGTHALVHRLARASELAKREHLTTVLENQTALLDRIANNCRAASRFMSDLDLSRIRFAVKTTVATVVVLSPTGASMECCKRYYDAMTRACERLASLRVRLQRYERVMRHGVVEVSE